MVIKGMHNTMTVNKREIRGLWGALNDIFSKKTLMALIFIVVGVIATYYLMEIFLTEKEFQYEKNSIVSIINTSGDKTRLEILDVRKLSLEQYIWMLEEKLIGCPTDIKLKFKINRLNDDLYIVKNSINAIKK
jgi:hypothetical protein